MTEVSSMCANIDKQNFGMQDAAHQILHATIHPSGSVDDGRDKQAIHACRSDSPSDRVRRLIDALARYQVAHPPSDRRQQAST